MDVSNDTITIKVDVDSFTCCYDCQTVNSIFSVKVEDVYEINKIKEDNNMSMLEKAKRVLEQINNNPKIQDEGYLDRNSLRNELEEFKLGINNRTTRTEMVKRLLCYIKEQEDIADEIAWNDTNSDKDIVREIYKEIIEKANDNECHNFISNWMLTSCVSKVIIGVPLKEKGADGKWIEYYKEFTDEQRALISKERKAFAEKASLKPHYNKNNELTGYFMPAKTVVYGRHKFLNKTCVYRYKNMATYHVNLNGVQDIKTGVITPLDDEAYRKLDELCTFVI